MRGLLSSLLGVLGVLAAAQPVFSQAWPQRPVKIVVPDAAGGPTDDLARLAARHLGAAFGQSFAVENRPGAGGAIAAETVARSAPDGYTLFLAGLQEVVITPLVTKTSLDPLRDLVAISAIASTPLVLAVHASLPVRSVAEFVTYARDQRGGLVYSAVGVGSITYVATTLFLKRTGTEMTPVLYKSEAPAMGDLVAGYVKVHFAPIPAVVPHATSDSLRLLAVSSAQRATRLPDVPTFVESGHPDFVVQSWAGLMAPAGTPKSIVDRLAREVSRALQDPQATAPLIANGIDPLGSTPEEFAAMIAADTPLWREAVKISGAR